MKKLPLIIFAFIAICSCNNLGQNNSAKENVDSTSYYDSIDSAMKAFDADIDRQIKQEDSIRLANLDKFEGEYKSDKTNETYTFNKDHTGTFVTGESTAYFEWKKSGKRVTVKFQYMKLNGESKKDEWGGTTVLRYDAKNHSVWEKSKIYDENIQFKK